MKVNYYSLALLLFICILVFSCKNSRRQLEEPNSIEQLNPKTIVDPQNREDTVFFGYILGESSKTITSKLIDENKIDVEHRVTFTIRRGGVSQVIYVEGYPFDLYIDDEKYTAYLSLFDGKGEKIDFRSNEKLMSLQIYIQGTENAPILGALRKQYGEPNTPPGDNYECFVPYGDIDAFWNISNKAVYLTTPGNFMVLVYEDIIAVRDLKNKEDAARKEKSEFNL